VSKTLFDDIVRTDPEPSRGEDSFAFLNRVATPYWERVRAFAERAFSAYPEEHAADLRGRFRDRRWPEHAGAWWELYLFTLFRSLGFEVEVHPRLSAVSTRPDFRVGTGAESFLVEARHVAAGLRSGRGVGRDEWITGPLDELFHPHFMVAVRIQQRAQRQPRRAAVIAGVLRWLDGLEPERVATDPTRRPSREFQAGDWRFELRALSIPQTPGRTGQRRLIAFFPAVSGRDNTATALQAALKEKARKYGKPECPLVLAPLLTTGHVATEDVVGALFGTEVYTFPLDAPGQGSYTRRPDGFWRFGDGYRGTRVSAVLIGDAVTPWTAAASLPRLWLHPAAAHPLTADLQLPTAQLDQDGNLRLTDANRSGADLLGLPRDWPGPEKRFELAA
jgi:hypothetical protein